LEDALVVYGDRQVAVANELTKLYESITRGHLSEVIAQLENEDIRGEYVVAIAGADD
jgi:16S rRNA (cytidine1402-2'-O)-methyltransferase